MTEPKRKLSAKQLVADISAGMTDRELARKYELTSHQLESVFQKLAKAGLLDGTRLDDRSASAKSRPVPAPSTLPPQTDVVQPKAPAHLAISSAAAESFLLNAASGIKGEWRACLSGDSLKLESPDGSHSVEIQAAEADEKLQLWESSLFPPFLVLLKPKRTAFKLDPDLLSRFKEWFGPPTAARLRQVLKPRFSFCIAIGILYLVTSMPLPGDSQVGIDPLPFDPVSAFLGVSLLVLALLAKFRPSRTLLLLDAVWFLLLTVNLGIGIYQGNSPWWLILGAVLLWTAYEALRDYQRLKLDDSVSARGKVAKPIAPQ
ncbi:MAG: hypothetical protein HY914_11150 [Desulfomonile tiedjei]|nr:hypothetical protein [Desulfomonile tiedjei]